jgi:hypothetical protein
MVAKSDARASNYNGRESTSTRNPHAAAKPLPPVKDLAKLSNEERVMRQWQAAHGCPISDEAKAQICVHALGRTYTLADVRLWQNQPWQIQKGDVTVCLEFFFDGSPDEFAGKEDEFKKAFETMVEGQLQEVRRAEFRKKLTARKRGGRKADGEDGLEGGGGLYDIDDSEWRKYLKSPLPATNLCIRSMREAGCMLRFLVCQTSISTSAAEVLGQIAFQEHFPVDGVIQESKSTKPLPKWVYAVGCCTMTFTVVSLMAWAKVVQTAVFHTPSPIPLAT